MALFAVVFVVGAQLVWAQETNSSPAPAAKTKPAQVEFDVPATLIGPGLDSVKRQLTPAKSEETDSASTTKNQTPPAKEVPQPPKPLVPGASVRQELLPSKNLPATPSAPQEPAPEKLLVPAPAILPELPPQGRETALIANDSPPGLREVKRLSKSEILAAVTDKWAAYFLRSNPRVLVLDFPTIREQARMFGRIIMFVERGGTSKTKVMTVPEVEKWLAQNAEKLESLTMGNNFRAGELARFFNTARFQGEPLTIDETTLYNLLLELQVLREELGVSIVQPEFVLISLPQVSSVPGCASCAVTPALRNVVLEHELSHARYATDTVYQNYVVWFWSQAISPATRTKFIQFLRKRGYDSNIPELLANEMQAFLLHTPDAAIFSAGQLGITESELNDLRENFKAGLFPKPPVVAQKPYQFE